MNASPIPTNARPPSASGAAVATPNAISPAAISTSPMVSARRGPIRSAASPAGTVHSR